MSNFLAVAGAFMLVSIVYIYLLNLNTLESNYNITGRLVCETCGGENFEFNEDKSYVKCIMCNREYFGGYDELVAFNQSNIDDTIQQNANEIADKAMNEIFKVFKGSKNIKLK